MEQDAQEERKEIQNRQAGMSNISMNSSSTCNEEEYDTFDSDAVHLGECNIATILASES